MITEGDAAIPLEMIRLIFRNQNKDQHCLQFHLSKLSLISLPISQLNNPNSQHCGRGREKTSINITSYHMTSVVLDEIVEAVGNTDYRGLLTPSVQNTEFQYARIFDVFVFWHFHRIMYQ